MVNVVGQMEYGEKMLFDTISLVSIFTGSCIAFINAWCVPNTLTKLINACKAYHRAFIKYFCTHLSQNQINIKETKHL